MGIRRNRAHARPQGLFRRLGLGCLVGALFGMPALGVAETGGYPTATVSTGQWRAQYQALGQVHARGMYTLNAPVRLQVQQVRVEAGQRVQRGETLARITVPALPDLLDRWIQTREAMRLSARELDNVRQRERNRLATHAEVLQVELRRHQALMQSDAAWQALARVLSGLGQPAVRREVVMQLDKTSPAAWLHAHSIVRAPFAGRVIWRTGETTSLARDARLFTLGRSDGVYIDVAVAPAQASLWRDATVHFSADGKNAGLNAGIAEHGVPLQRAAQAPRYDSASGMMIWRFRAQVSETGASLPALLDGQWGKATAQLPPRQVVWVPAVAVVLRQGRTYCILADARGYRAVPVTVPDNVSSAVEAARDAGRRVPVLAGLQAGQRVVTRGAYELLYRDLNSLMQPDD